jgi:hypothetical protein
LPVCNMTNPTNGVMIAACKIILITSHLK